MRLTLDYPPVWLAALVVPAWMAGRTLPHGPGWMVSAGWLTVGTGVMLMTLAVLTMLRARTTLDPHGQPHTLVTTGIYAWSRNPIYLADAVILAGLCLAFRAPLAALLVVPAFVAIARRRFIGPEEARLIAAFPADFPAYARRTRRWL